MYRVKTAVKRDTTLTPRPARFRVFLIDIRSTSIFCVLVWPSVCLSIFTMSDQNMRLYFRL